MDTGDASEESKKAARDFKTILSECMEKNDDGSMDLKIHFPDDSFRGNFAEVLGKIAARKK
ncbi:MAG TPA: hypothetical protein ENI06_04210 [Spirochaetales bacterium]|nr:hypothetical protein [Spirochaetales bacterium]